MKKILDAIFNEKGILIFGFLCLAFILVMSCCMAIFDGYPSSKDEEGDVYTVYLIVKSEDETESVEPEDPDISEEETGYTFTEDEINLIAKLTEAEAGNQSELGKRLVIDTVLNRLDHPNFPNTVHDVIYQKNQFSPATSGKIDLYSPTEENLRLVREEIERRTESECVFFRADHYGKYGTPMYAIGDHYFSSYV